MADENICEFCKNKFTNRSSLIKHQKSARYCITIQNGTSEIFSCEWCQKEFTRQDNFTRHQCPGKIVADEKIKIQKQNHEFKQKLKLEKLKVMNQLRILERKYKEKCIEYDFLRKDFEQIQKTNTDRGRELSLLKNENKELMKKYCYTEGKVDGIVQGVKIAPSSTVKNTGTSIKIHPKLANIRTDKISPLTDEYIQSRVKDFSRELFQRGAIGIADYIEKQVLYVDDDGTKHMNYFCVDASRNKFVKHKQLQEWVSDNRGYVIRQFIQSLKEPIRTYFHELAEAKRQANRSENAADIEYYTELITPVRYIYRGVVHNEDFEKVFADCRSSLRNRLT